MIDKISDLWGAVVFFGWALVIGAAWLALIIALVAGPPLAALYFLVRFVKWAWSG